eukprot:1058627-Prorocentrum_minimum.AAC.4
MQTVHWLDGNVAEANSDDCTVPIVTATGEEVTSSPTRDPAPKDDTAADQATLKAASTPKPEFARLSKKRERDASPVPTPTPMPTPTPASNKRERAPSPEITPAERGSRGWERSSGSGSGAGSSRADKEEMRSLGSKPEDRGRAPSPPRRCRLHVEVDPSLIIPLDGRPSRPQRSQQEKKAEAPAASAVLPGGQDMICGAVKGVLLLGGRREEEWVRLRHHTGGDVKVRTTQDGPNAHPPLLAPLLA